MVVDLGLSQLLARILDVKPSSSVNIPPKIATLDKFFNFSLYGYNPTRIDSICFCHGSRGLQQMRPLQVLFILYLYQNFSSGGEKGCIVIIFINKVLLLGGLSIE